MDLSCLVNCAKLNFKYTFFNVFLFIEFKNHNRFSDKYIFFYSKHAKLIVSYLILKKRGRISDTAAVFPWGKLRWDSHSAFGASIRLTLLAIGAIAEKLINFTLLVPGDNNTLELISYWTAKIYWSLRIIGRTFDFYFFFHRVCWLG